MNPIKFRTMGESGYTLGGFFQKTLTLLLCIALKTNLFSQTVLTGKVCGADSAGVPKATVGLFRQKDSVVVLTVITDSSGIFRIEGVSPTAYGIDVRCLGYERKVIPAVLFRGSKDKIDLGVIRLIIQPALLQEVAVTASPAGMEQRDGKLVIDVSHSVTSAGSSVLEVLERLPSVTVNRQTNSFSIKGKEGATVMINGKITYMPEDALFQFLSGLNADNIEKIEIIATPSSDMDAEGKAGFINIVLKKGIHEGWHGNAGVDAGYGQGSLAGVNGDVSYLSGRWAINANYYFSRVAQDQVSYNYRQYQYKGDLFTSNTNSERHPVQTDHNLSVNASYNLSKSSEIGGGFSFFDNRWMMNALNSSTITRGAIDSVISIPNNEINHWRHFGGDLDFRHSFRNKGVFSAWVDYLYYKDDNPAFYNDQYYDGQGQFLEQQSTRTVKGTPISIFVGKLDYTLPVDQRWTISAGAKTSLSHLSNQVNVTTLEQGTWEDDSALTNNSSLQENILAAYAEFTYKPDNKVDFKGGLRYEYTNYRLFLAGTSDMSYGNLFPSVALNYHVSAASVLTLSYTKRINRPSFTDLAPFVLFIDPYTLFQGNAGVHSSVSDQLGLDYAFGKFILSLGYSFEGQALSKFQISVDSLTNLEMIEPQNLAGIKTFNAGIIAPLKLYSFWSMRGSLSALWQDVNTGAALGDRQLKKWSWQLSGTQSFKIPGAIYFEITGFYNSTILSGGSAVQSVGGLNLGLKRTFGKSVFSLNYTDILHTIKYTSLVTGPGLFIRNGFDFSQPTLKISYTYRFGSSGPAPSMKSNHSADDERRRVE